MHRMTSSHFEGWLDKYGQAWERGDAEGAILLFWESSLHGWRASGQL